MFIESFSAQETVPFLKYVQSFGVTRVTPFFATLGVYRVTFTLIIRRKRKSSGSHNKQGMTLLNIPRAAEISSSKEYD